MKLVIQRVRDGAVTADAERHRAEIGRGLVILLGVEKGDTAAEADWLAEKVSALRIFEDEAGKMNRSLLEIGGEALVVSQFTLVGRCDKGRRPSFDAAAPPGLAKPLYEHFCGKLTSLGVRKVATGIFGEKMAVSLVNDGPVTFILEQRPRSE